MSIRSFHGLLPLLATAIAAVFGAAPVAHAAPQVVAALPTAGAVHLACADGTCAAEISTICLQQDRPTPDRHAGYQIHGPDAGALRVTGTTADGRTVVLGADILEFSALRGQVAFRVQIGADVLRQNGLGAVAVAVRRPAILTPEPEVGDPYPLRPADVARAETTLAAVVGGWSARHADGIATARVAGRILNRLPARGTVPEARAEALLSEATAAESRLTPEARAWTESFVRRCREADAGLGEGSMRRCLTRFHDRTLQDLNTHYWRAAKPQS